MKTLKSIQKNQEQLNSLLMEKWGYKTNEGTEPPESTWTSTNPGEKTDADDKDIEARDAKRAELIANLPAEEEEKKKVAKEKKGQEETLEEEHNCKSAHPGKTHEQWAGKYR